MGKKIILLLIFFIYYSCADKKDEIKYDSADYYKFVSSLNNLDFGNEKTFNVFNNSFDSLNINKYSKLKEIGYIKKNNKINKTHILDKLKTENFKQSNQCVSLYEDIFVFYLKQEIIAVVKFDFQCNKTSIIVNENNKLKIVYINNTDLFSSLLIPAAQSLPTLSHK